MLIRGTAAPPEPKAIGSGIGEVYFSSDLGKLTLNALRVLFRIFSSEIRRFFPAYGIQSSRLLSSCAIESWSWDFKQQREM